jgi:hypothetical protein
MDMVGHSAVAETGPEGHWRVGGDPQDPRKHQAPCLVLGRGLQDLKRQIHS